jgi:lysophospholipase L1-like esterase
VSHVVLLGDSIFDNQAYVGGGPDVIQQLRALLAPGWKATLLAVDGHVTGDVAERQLPRIPEGASHLIVSVGGNDALGRASLLQEPVNSVGEGIHRLSIACEAFEEVYGEMLRAILARGLPTALCTIYDTAFPEPYRTIATRALALFNDAITRAAFGNGLDIIDLRLVCDEPADYANPIEPSSAGGQKIAAAIARFIASPASRSGSAVWI